ncbi:hypothetical protein [Pseudomonas aeruginosa]|uniref:hypothetical protein n=1 Tax=Pseudomonas aeruginosa TaxID=287 RepID=UPI00071B737B|nr:hypothetical protein [Pseudomonas aeruginosa]KSR43351.1 hypothetical protein APB45_17255 [Pseudomonas aeruginosa]RPV13619.1 hypothetical protein IPC878_08580 [Pseudomonas aeruginosa]
MIGWGRACIGIGGLLLLGQLLGGALLLGGKGESALAAEHFWQFVFLLPAILVALGMFVLQRHAGSFAQLYRRRLDGASYLLVACGIALVLGKLCALLLA